MNMIVTRNTYPRWEKVDRAEVGDLVRWECVRHQWLLVRLCDCRAVFARDCLPKDVEDNRPRIGVIASVKSRGWFLEIAIAQTGGQPFENGHDREGARP